MKSTEPLAVSIKVIQGDAGTSEYQFTDSFRIGRGHDCQLKILDTSVSRSHAEVLLIGGRWWVQDSDSGNGTYVNGKRIDRATIEDEDRIKLGLQGPVLLVNFTGQQNTASKKPGLKSLDQYEEYYFKDDNRDDIGEHTMMVRRAFKKVHKKQKKKYTKIIALVLCLFLLAGGYAIFKHFQVQKQKELAEGIFYAMKSFELEFAEFIKTARDSKDKKVLAQAEKYKTKKKEMEKSYNEIVTSLKVYEKAKTKEEELILRVARIFGECEINIPEGFVKEVSKYIDKWKKTRRYEMAINLAKKEKYIKTIGHTLMKNDLPPQFFYLALQESDFKRNACGPKTRFGIAKGMWQFIPSTATRYGLKTGPLEKKRQPDKKDDRHNVKLATQAAAKYLRDIYDTEAQASGLLVMASYNWGERRVINLIRKMPQNPKERNFWNLLTKYKSKIPKQTYDYVFYIVSAAVIGENPRLFGFDFDNPLVEFETA